MSNSFNVLLLPNAFITIVVSPFSLESASDRDSMHYNKQEINIMHPDNYRCGQPVQEIKNINKNQNKI